MKELRKRNSALIAEKLDRLSRGESPRVLDVFSGCGGLMLGFHRAGCISIGGLDIDPDAARSYARNFHPGESEELLCLHAAPKDITRLEPNRLMAQFGYARPGAVVDFFIGGPPCPTFTRVGRAKLREVQDHPEAFRLDPRSKLYIPYLQYAKELAPLVLLLENVPDFLNWGGHNLAEEICEVLEGLGYLCSYTLLNAANYGVPQMRERMFLMAVHSAVGGAPGFPAPTRLVNFPSGYEGSRDVALKCLRDLPLFGRLARYIPPPQPGRGALPPVTVREAIADLPPITAHLEGNDRRGARRFDKPIKYKAQAKLSSYAKDMRNWPGFESDGLIWDHVTRSLSLRDYRLFEQMKEGDDYPKAFTLAEELFQAELARMKGVGRVIVPGSKAYQELRALFVPPYDPNKFPNKWRKMEPDQPARTLMAHLGKDSYTHIHYDSGQARVISVREAARLQSFPDGFRFSGTMNPAFRQIGNAVPPLLSFAIAREIMDIVGLGADSPASTDMGADLLECEA